MFKEIALAVVQAITEFLPISSDGHLAIISKFFGGTNLFFITFLHLASLLAVLIFTRKEIYGILKFNRESWKIIQYILIGIIPAGIAGFLFSDLIEKTLSSFLLVGFFFLLNGIIIFSTKFAKKSDKKINRKNSFFIGLMQAPALLPGISRSGMTISAGIFSGLSREKAVKFSFLMFIPLALGAFGLEFMKNPGLISSIPLLTLISSFVICFVLSFFCLNLLSYILKTDKFWIFGIYCILVSIIIFLFFIAKIQ
jgi:undecaprenyl-diphosphatase